MKKSILFAALALAFAGAITLMAGGINAGTPKLFSYTGGTTSKTVISANGCVAEKVEILFTSGNIGDKYNVSIYNAPTAALATTPVAVYGLQVTSTTQVLNLQYYLPSGCVIGTTITGGTVQGQVSSNPL